MEFLLAIYVDYHHVCDPSLHNVHPLCPTLEIMRGWEGRNDSIMVGSLAASVIGGVRPLNNANQKEDAAGAGWDSKELFVPTRLYGDHDLLTIVREDSPLLFSVFCKKVFDDAIDLSQIQSLKDHMEAHLQEKVSPRKLSAEEREAKAKALLLKSYLDPSQEEKEDPMAAFASFFEGETKPVEASLAKVQKPEVSEEDKGQMLAWLLQNDLISKVMFNDERLVEMIDEPGLAPFQEAHKTYLHRLAVHKSKVKELKSSARKDKREKAKLEKKAAQLASDATSHGPTADALPSNGTDANAADIVAKHLTFSGGDAPPGGEKRAVDDNAVLAPEPAKRARSGSVTRNTQKDKEEEQNPEEEEAIASDEEEQNPEEEEAIASDSKEEEAEEEIASDDKEEEPNAFDNDPLEPGLPSENNAVSDETMVPVVDETSKDEVTGALPNSVSHDSENASGSMHEDDN